MSGEDGTELPHGWVKTSLGEAFDWGSGGTPRSTVQAYYGGGIPWAVIGDLDDGPVTETARTITEKGLAESSAKWVNQGSVLVAMYGSIGKLGIAQKPLTTNQAIAFTDPSPIDPKYLFWYLYSRRDELVALGKGGTQQNISQTVIKAFPFVLAPEAERRRIVETLEHLDSRIEAAVANLRRSSANLDRYRASIPQAACEGRLMMTEAELARQEGRDYEPADELVDRILAERRARWETQKLENLKAKGKEPKDDRWKENYKEPEEPDTSELPELPEGWTWALVEQLGEVQGGITKGQKRRKGKEYRSVPYLRVANVQRGYLDLSEMKEIEAPVDTIERLRLEVGDVLFNEGGDRDKLGRGWVWEGQIDECIHQNHVFRVRPYSADLEPKYLSFFGNSAAQTYFVEHGVQTTNLASVNMTKLKALPVALPPASEQVRIVQETERQLSLLDRLEDETGSALKRSQRLRSSVLSAAFGGRMFRAVGPLQEPTEESPLHAYAER